MMIPVSDCCLATVKIKRQYVGIENVILEEDENPNYCSKCGKDCEMIAKPKN